MKETFYKLIYNGKVNWILRNINKSLKLFLPFKIPPAGIITIKIDKKTQFKMYTNQSNYLTKIVFWEGCESFEYTPVFIDIVRNTSTFFDIGANIGYYSLLASTINKSINVVGFEPARGPLNYFRKNVLLNNFNQIKVESIALSDKNEEIDFYEISNPKYQYLEFNLAGESNTAGNVENRKYKINKVLTVTLDDYVRTNKFENIDLIKIDTEGTEHLILGHSDNVLSIMKPIVICETLFGRNEKELEEIFSKHGYLFYNHTLRGLEKTETLIREKENGVNNCFFVHPTKFDLISKYVYIDKTSIN
jgi:FkbM family methyltransferase